MAVTIRLTKTFYPCHWTSLKVITPLTEIYKYVCVCEYINGWENDWLNMTLKYGVIVSKRLHNVKKKSQISLYTSLVL